MTQDVDFRALQDQVHREHEARERQVLALLHAAAVHRPRHAAAWLRLGTVQLEGALSWHGAQALPAAEASLRRAADLAPRDAVARAALARCLDAQDRPAEALAVARQAAALAPQDAVLHALVATLAADHLPAQDAGPLVAAAAAASGVELPAGGAWPDRVRQGFVHARNHLDSRLRKARGAIDKRVLGRDAEALVAEDLAEARRTLKQRVTKARVPGFMAPLVPWAQRLGLGDDGLRGLAVSQLSPPEAARLLADLAPHDAAITAWIGEHPAGAWPDEVAAFAALQLAAEEVRAAGGR